MKRRGRKSWKEVSPPLIAATFSESPTKIFQERALRSAIKEWRGEWLVPESLANTEIIQFLLEQTPLKVVQVSSDYESQNGIRYCWGDVSPFMVANSIRPNSYLCYSTACYLLGLLDEIPHTLYLNKEQSPKPSPDGELQQAAIDRAFANRQRQSAMIIKWEQYQVVVINGKHTGLLGVVRIKDPTGASLIHCTNLERTLIDITVRPAYSGGVHKVLEAYERALPDVSATRMAALLKKLDYKYPYHQNIGFFMQKAGYSAKSYERFSNLGLDVDFYLDYGMKQKEYVSEWRLYVPEGLGL